MINPVGNNGYDKIAKILTSKPIQKAIKYADKNPAIFQSATIFTMSSILRPGVIMAMPAKTDDNKRDRLYSASKSIASGITDLLFSIALFMPVNKIINKTADAFYTNPKAILYKDKNACKMYKNLMNRGLKLLAIPIIAFLNFKYLKNIANILVNMENKNENK